MDNTNVRVDLIIMGDKFDVQEITKVLEITPTATWSRGDCIRNTGKKHLYTAWIFSTGVEETLDINTQLNKIENIFISEVDKLCTLKKQYNLDFSIDIVIVIENESPPAIYLESSSVQFAARIAARFDIDTYVN